MTEEDAPRKRNGCNTDCNSDNCGQGLLAGKWGGGFASSFYCLEGNSAWMERPYS